MNYYLIDFENVHADGFKVLKGLTEGDTVIIFYSDNSKNITFDTLPADPKLLQGYSYAVPRLNEWLEMINEKLNPYEEPITQWQLNLVYCDWMGHYFGTNGLDGAWYYDQGDGVS